MQADKKIKQEQEITLQSHGENHLEEKHGQNEEEEKKEDAENLETDTIEEGKEFLQDVENFIENERVALSQTENLEIDSQYVPQEGMEFSSANDAQKFFNTYAYLAGFAAIIILVIQITIIKITTIFISSENNKA